MIQSSDAVVALSIAMMNNPANPNDNPICNKQISIHNPAAGTDTVATVVDTCQACQFGDIDAMPDLFKKIAPNGDGRVHGIEWTPIGWTVPGASSSSEDGSSSSQPSASAAAVQSAPSTTAAAEAVPSVAVQEKDAVAAAAPSETPTPSAAPSVAPAMPSAAPAASSTSCTTPGQSVCSADGTQIGTCTVGLTVEMGPVADGTKCENGYMVMANSRLRSRRS